MTTGIICELNPLHNGHVKIIEYAKENSDVVVGIMSGNYTQRGEIACLEKHDRAASAILAGCDIVVEIPITHVLSSAPYYAKAGVEIAKVAKVDKIIFGSESGNIDDLKKLAQISQSPELDSRIKHYLKDGVNYPTAFQLALDEIGDENLSSIAKLPNNMLGIEYIKQAQIHNIEIDTIKRKNSYLSEDISGEFASAAAIRKYTIASEYDKIYMHIPMFMRGNVKNIKDISSKLFTLLSYKIKGMSAAELNNIYDMNEGIENRIIKAINSSSSYDELVSNIKSKRYTQTKIQRLLLHILLDITKDQASYALNTQLQFTNVLAIDNESFALLKNQNLLTKYKDFEKFGLIDKDIFKVNKRGDDLFSSIYNAKYQPNMKII